jgi:hypothetical protein
MRDELNLDTTISGEDKTKVQKVFGGLDLG